MKSSMRKFYLAVFAALTISCLTVPAASAKVNHKEYVASVAHYYPAGSSFLGVLFTKVTGAGSGRSLQVYGVAKTQSGVLGLKTVTIDVKASGGLSRIVVKAKTDVHGKFNYTVREIARQPGVYLVTVSYGKSSISRAVTVKN